MLFYFTISFTGFCFENIHPEVIGKKVKSESPTGTRKHFSPSL